MCKYKLNGKLPLKRYKAFVINEGRLQNTNFQFNAYIDSQLSI